MDVNSINFLLLLNILMLSCGCNAVNIGVYSIYYCFAQMESQRINCLFDNLKNKC